MTSAGSLSSSFVPLLALSLLFAGYGVSSVLGRNPLALVGEEEGNDVGHGFLLQPEKIQMWFKNVADSLSTAVSERVDAVIQRNPWIQQHGSNANADENVEGGPHRRQLAGYGGGTSYSWPTSTGSQKVAGTMTITGTFNGGYRTFSGFGDGGQSEGQACMFLLEDGATIENVIIAPPAADGIHCRGSCTLRNIFWLDVGEDAATLKGSSPRDVMTVEGGGAQGAADKVFMSNGPGTFVIRNFFAVNIGKLWRSCGNCRVQHQRHVVLEDVLVVNADDGIVGINVNNGDTATISRLRVVGSETAVCVKFRSAPRGSEPTKLGEGPDGTSCKYKMSDVIFGSGGGFSGGPGPVPTTPREGGEPRPPMSGQGYRREAPRLSGGGYGTRPKRSPPPRRRPPPPKRRRSPPPRRYGKWYRSPPKKSGSQKKRSPPPRRRYQRRRSSSNQ